MTPQLGPYTPSLYQPDAYGRYRQYPRVVTAPIPGVGYDVGRLAWAEQELNLDGGGPPENYGSYRTVPLRGLGAVAPSAAMSAAISQNRMVAPNILKTITTGGEQGAPSSSEVDVEEIAAADADAAAVAAQFEAEQSAEDSGFFAKKVGPVPLWALLAGGAVAASGGAWWLLRRRKRVASNRRSR